MDVRIIEDRLQRASYVGGGGFCRVYSLDTWDVRYVQGKRSPCYNQVCVPCFGGDGLTCLSSGPQMGVTCLLFPSTACHHKDQLATLQGCDWVGAGGGADAAAGKDVLEDLPVDRKPLADSRLMGTQARDALARCPHLPCLCTLQSHYLREKHAHIVLAGQPRVVQLFHTFEGVLQVPVAGGMRVPMQVHPAPAERVLPRCGRKRCAPRLWMAQCCAGGAAP